MKTISTQNLERLPNRRKLQMICKSISALEAIICPEWEYRYYSYQKDWSETEEFCEMRNGLGDHMLIVFSENGTCINGFAHESKMNGWQNNEIDPKMLNSGQDVQPALTQKIAKGVVDELPEVFHEFIFGEPVKSIGTTFCIWQTQADDNWKIGKVNLPNDEYKDGSSDLLQLLDGSPMTYKTWAEEYYEEDFEDEELKLELVEKIYNGELITKDLVLGLNPELDDFQQLKSDLNEIGYAHRI